MQGLGALALVVGLSACGGTDDLATNAAANDMNTMTAESDNPFARSEKTMDVSMMSAVGVNTADSWVRKMIEHHRGAVDMSRIALTRNPTADVRKMAQATIVKQGKEISDLERLVATGSSDLASAEVYRPAATQMHRSMMAAMGANVSETYLRKMLAHHRGAVAMSEIALANGATGAVRAQFEKTRTDQQMEVETIEAMLRGEPMASQTAKSGASPAASRSSAPAKPAPASAKTNSAAPAPDPHAGMDMNNM